MNRNETKVLVRRQQGRRAAGDCAGAAGYSGGGVTLFRVIVAVISASAGGAGYVLAWATVPQQGEPSSPAFLGKNDVEATQLAGRDPRSRGTAR